MSNSIYADFSEPSTPCEQAAAPSHEPVVRQEKKRSGTPKLLILALLVTAGGAALWSIAAASSRASSVLDYLPNNPALIVQIDGARLTSSPLYEDLKKFVAPYITSTGPHDPTELFEAIESCIDTLTWGMKLPESLRRSGNQQFAGALRCRQDLVLADFIPGDFHSYEVIEGKAIYVSKGFAFCQIDARTVAFGTVDSLREVLQRGGARATISPQLTKALSAADFFQALTIVAVASEEAADEIQRMSRTAGIDLPESLVLNADFNSGLRITASVVMKEESDVQEIMKRVKPALEKVKTQSGEAKQVLDSMDLSTSGATLTVAVTVPGSLIRERLENRPTRLTSNNKTTVYECQRNTAELNAALERFYFDTGKWPRNVAEMAKYFITDLPQYCSLHQSAYSINPKDHRITNHKSPLTGKSANTSKSYLQAVRIAIQAFKDDHDGAFPSLQNGGLPALLERTSLDGACDDNCRFGPYLSQMPKNELNGLATVKRPEHVPPQSADGTTGWYYDPQSGGIWLNSNTSGLAEFSW